MLPEVRRDEAAKMRANPLAGRSKRPQIAIVGAGNLARALALSLHTAGYEIEQIVARESALSLRRARRLAKQVGAVAVTVQKAHVHADLVWFCVPDGAIREAAASLERSTEWNGKIALHSSGALTSDELARLRRRGARVASAHPLMTFVRGSQPRIKNVPFAIEGDRDAIHQARGIVRNLGGDAYSIHAKDKPAYHAWGMFASPLMIALLAATEQVAMRAGLEKAAARKRMLPILWQTLANYESLGAASSFSGPIARGDVETVKKHLRELRNAPEIFEVYLALAQAALRNLPAKNRSTMRQILKI